MKSLFILIIAISLFSCLDNKSPKEIKKVVPVVKVDSTKKGVIGSPESTLEIITRVDTVIRKRETKYWDENKKLFQRVEYFDSLGHEFKQTDFDFYKNEKRHSYVWYDTTKSMFVGNESVARIDSAFSSSGKLKQVQQRYLKTELTEYYGSKGGIYKKYIYSEELLYSFFEEDNEFYARRNDIPLEYAEWIRTSRTEFGQAIKLFYDSKINAQIRFKKLYNKELD